MSVSVFKSGQPGLYKKITINNDTPGKQIIKFGTRVTIWRKESDGTLKNSVEILNDDPAQLKKTSH